MIYFLQRADGAIKIGYSSNPVARILPQVLPKRKHGERVLIGTMPGTLEDEARLHERFWPLRKAKRGWNGQDFEWHHPSEELVTFIQQHRDPECKAAYEVFIRVQLRRAGIAIHRWQLTPCYTVVFR